LSGSHFFDSTLLAMPSMIDSKKKNAKPKRGRPLGSRTTFIGKAIGLRLYPDLEAKIDEWIERQAPARPSKPEAIRRLLEQAFAAAPAPRKAEGKQMRRKAP
jgi:hypothetical protein